MTKLTNEEFIQKAKLIHGNKYDYSKVVYIDCFTEITIHCSEHGDFNQVPTYHLNKIGCKKCTNNKTNKLKTVNFLRKAKEIHRDKYDYSKFIYTNKDTKGIIICPVHSEFEQSPSNHLKTECYKCAKDKTRKNLETFINEVKIVHGDKYDYSKSNYLNSHTKITIICESHGNFEQIPSDHLAGKGCKKCAEENGRSTTEEFIEKTNAIHKEKYEYSKVIYTDCKTKITIICPEHGAFEQTPNSHLSKRGCRKCADKITTSLKEFIENAKRIHNDIYDYSSVIYKGVNKNVTITCPKHGDFEQQPRKHLSGQQCRKCGMEKIRMGLTEFIKRSNKIHNNTYDYSKAIYTTSDEDIEIICKTHGSFFQSPSNHLSDKGCVKCYHDTKRKTNGEFINDAKKIHGDMYDYSNVNYIDVETKVEIICKKHGSFCQQPKHHLNLKEKRGCRKCAVICYSKKSIKWLEYVANQKNVKIQHAENEGEFRIPETKYSADGYCKETNTIYEFHGTYHHGAPHIYDKNIINKMHNCTMGELYDKTCEKENTIKNLGYDLVTIWEDEWDKINKKK
ncbi:MAG: hypothetical protein Terrestrivirus9_28 [Terrestrivirus sp.]|uniref:Uncharacterized protein n=1 Tax=Terrestrivirus sp. TaxID=2487775 RepID=A0A3G4ZRH9_9VIRU|nr:MAG: hypothetical protein Terrestrivirus9_28 [Terrestrivirus sp.]